MVWRRSSTALLVTGGMLLARVAHAEDVTDAVAGHSGVTYAQLLRQALPELKAGADKTWDSGPIAHLRDIDGKASEADGLTFGSLDVLHVREGGHRRLLLLTDEASGEGGFSALLLAFDDEAQVPRLLDKMDVGQDRLTGMGRVFDIGGGTEAFLVDNEHDNSNQSYTLTTPLYMRGGRLRTVATLFTYGERLCGVQETQELRVSARQEPGRRYRSIAVKVIRVVKHPEEDCEPGPHAPKAGTRVYSDLYRWDEGKQAFRPVTRAVERLSDASFKRATE
jgi:hypothetical protein